MRDFISSLKFLYQNQLIESQNQQFFRKRKKGIRRRKQSLAY